MDKSIVGVEFRHQLPVAYVQVAGNSQFQAEKRARKACSAFRLIFPYDHIGVPRYKGKDEQTLRDRYEIPIILKSDPREAKRILSRLVLKGTV